MNFAQLNEDGSFGRELENYVNYEWDGNNFCSVQALVKDGKAEQFRVVPLIETEPPEIDPMTQRVYRDGGELVNGQWQYKWVIHNLTKEDLEALANEKRVSIQAEIDRLEGYPNYLNRGARELQLRLMEKEGAELAAARGLTKEQVLAATPYYVRLKALDEEIKALRVQL